MKSKKTVLFILGMVLVLIIGSGFIGKSKTDKAEKILPAYSFQLEDQKGNLHKLSEYKGKTVFLNFWATWCPNCVEEMAAIQEIYKEYGKNQKDVIVLTMANPSSKEYPQNNDEDISKVKQFIQKKQYEFPVLMDKTGEIFNQYHIRAFPTTFMITKEGNIKGFVMGAITKKDMKNIIENTKSGK